MKDSYGISGLIDSVQNNQSQRFNCFNCGGIYTLSISKENGKAKYHCFKASCNLNGSVKYLISIDEIKNKRFEKQEIFEIPTYLSYGTSSIKTKDWLLKTHSVEAYKKGLFEIAYDPKQDRICYLIRKNNEIVGIVGRAYTNKVKPKVLNYKGSDNNIPFICGNTDSIVLVEDCASACAVTRIAELSGLALLGTNLKDEYITVIKQYKRIIVALDRDARKKTLAIWQKLKYHCTRVEIWFLENDIKNMLDDELNSSYIKFNAIPHR